MENLKEIFTNHMLFAPISAWMFSQIVKAVVNFCIYKKLLKKAPTAGKQIKHMIQIRFLFKAAPKVCLFSLLQRFIM
jgi:hypothetical protein